MVAELTSLSDPISSRSPSPWLYGSILPEETASVLGMPVYNSI
jgi:hypothetical protein